jgi:hypothetical protein
MSVVAGSAVAASLIAALAFLSDRLPPSEKTAEMPPQKIGAGIEA